MAINYTLHKTSGTTSKVNKVFAIANSVRTISINELIEDMVKGKTLTKSDALAAISALTAELSKKISQGYRIKIKGLGILSPSLAIDKDISDDKYLHEQHLKVKHINFKADKEFLWDCNNCSFEQKRTTKMNTTRNERWYILRKYLQKKESINKTIYMRLVQAYLYQANNDLQSWENEGLLSKTKFGRFYLYKLK